MCGGRDLAALKKPAMPQSGLFILYSTALIPILPFTQHSCSPSLISVIWMENTHTILICLASQSLLLPLLRAAFLNFLLQRLEKFPERREQGEREFFISGLVPEIFFPLCCWIYCASQNSSNIQLPSRPGRHFLLSVGVCLGCTSLVHILGWIFGSSWLFQELWYARWESGCGESPFTPKVLEVIFSLFITIYC